MNDGWTGLNLVEAKANIEKLIDDIEKIEQSFYNTYYDFVDGLEANSNSRVISSLINSESIDGGANFTFNGTGFELLITGRAVFNNLKKNICTHATEAYNSLSLANGGTTIQVDYNREVSKTMAHDSFAGNYRFNSGEAEGMVISAVRSVASEFLSKMKEVFTNLAAVDTSIAFYDPNGELKESFNKFVVYGTEVITNLSEALVAKVNEAVDQAAEMLEQGVVQAAAELNS